MNGELNYLQSENEGVSLAEQVAIKERTESLKMFKERKASIIESIDILMAGIEKTREKVQEANEVVFQTVRRDFIEFCQYLLPNKLVDLIKVGQYVQDGVKFRFSNLSDGLNDSPHDWKINLDELSGVYCALIFHLLKQMLVSCQLKSSDCSNRIQGKAQKYHLTFGYLSENSKISKFPEYPLIVLIFYCRGGILENLKNLRVVRRKLKKLGVFWCFSLYL